jgi:hypothetical protein
MTIWGGFWNCRLKNIPSERLMLITVPPTELLDSVKLSNGERHCTGVILELGRRPSKTVQIVLPQNKAKEVLREFHGGFLGGHLGVNKTWARFDNSAIGYT